MHSSSEKLTDARGRTLEPGPYRRVASLVPSLTDTVCSLGAESRLVARTIYCTEPRQKVQDVPACGGTKNPDVKQIVIQEPDLVLACLEENPPGAIDQLEQAGKAVFAIMPRTMSDVAALLQDFGNLLDRTEAAADAVAELTAARSEAARWRSHRGGQTFRGAALIWKKPWMAAGGGTYINSVMDELGIINVLADRRDYFEITTEELVGLDLVLLPDEPFPFTHHDAWRLAAAGVVPDRKRAILLDGKLLCWYGGRTAASLKTLVGIMDARLG